MKKHDRGNHWSFALFGVLSGANPMSPFWKVSMRLQLGDQWVSIAGPRDALSVIEEAWPSEPGPLCQLARRRCYESLQADGVADQSRNPFIAAVIEAQIFCV